MDVRVHIPDTTSQDQECRVVWTLREKVQFSSIKFRAALCKHQDVTVCVLEVGIVKLENLFCVCMCLLAHDDLELLEMPH